jgi:hypothetical protein
LGDPAFLLLPTDGKVEDSFRIAGSKHRHREWGRLIYHPGPVLVPRPIRS